MKSKDVMPVLVPYAANRSVICHQQASLSSAWAVAQPKHDSNISLLQDLSTICSSACRDRVQTVSHLCVNKAAKDHIVQQSDFDSGMSHAIG